MLRRPRAPETPLEPLHNTPPRWSSSSIGSEGPSCPQTHVLSPRILSIPPTWQIYTAIGPIVLALNPFAPTEECTPARFAALAAEPDPDKLPPHAFCVARSAYSVMAATGRPQAILISGESGAGKARTGDHRSGPRTHSLARRAARALMPHPASHVAPRASHLPPPTSRFPPPASCRLSLVNSTDGDRQDLHELPCAALQLAVTRNQPRAPVGSTPRGFWECAHRYESQLVPIWQVGGGVRCVVGWHST